jgi:hypothetical protein
VVEGLLVYILADKDAQCKIGYHGIRVDIDYDFWACGKSREEIVAQLEADRKAKEEFAGGSRRGAHLVRPSPGPGNRGHAQDKRPRLLK